MTATGRRLSLDVAADLEPDAGRMFAGPGRKIGREAQLRIYTLIARVGDLASSKGELEAEITSWASTTGPTRSTGEACTLPAHETTLMAVSTELLKARWPLIERLAADPRDFDVHAAAYWLWGRSVSFGGRWCSDDPSQRRAPKLALHGGQTGPGIGQGVLSSTLSDQLPAYFASLADRLRHVRLTCGDWTRVLTRSVTTIHGVTGVYIDRCYALETGRRADLDGIEEPEKSPAVRAWALKHGDDPRLRIVVSGLEGEHVELERHGWSVVVWRGRERMWLSPHCQLEEFGPLFAVEASA